MVSIHLKNSSQNRPFPQIGVKIKKYLKPYNLIWVGGCGVDINDLAFENLGTFRCMIMLRSPGCKVASVYESVCDCVCVCKHQMYVAQICMYQFHIMYVYMPRNILCMKVHMNVSKIIQICVPFFASEYSCAWGQSKMLPSQTFC